MAGSNVACKFQSHIEQSYYFFLDQQNEKKSGKSAVRAKITAEQGKRPLDKGDLFTAEIKPEIEQRNRAKKKAGTTKIVRKNKKIPQKKAIKTAKPVPEKVKEIKEKKETTPTGKDVEKSSRLVVTVEKMSPEKLKTCAKGGKEKTEKLRAGVEMPPEKEVR